MDEERRLIKALSNLKKLTEDGIWKAAASKTVSESIKARKQGNELYARNDHDERMHIDILRWYTRSAAFAPPGSEELGLAYGNRSAALMHLGKYKECLEDLDRALETTLSEEQLIKYLCRKVECQAELGMEEAKITCEEAKFVLQEMETSDSVKENIVIKLVNSIVKLEKIQLEKQEKQENKMSIYLLDSEKLAKHRSPECPQASNAVSITRDGKYPRYGRHLTATRDIFPAEVLYAAKPYVSFPMESRVHSNCSQCLRFLWAGIPCENCVYAVYCSLECRDEARRLYHDVECKIIDKAWKEYGTMNTGRLISLRMLIMALKEAGNLENLRSSIENVDCVTDLRRKGFSNEQTVFINNYKSAYSLSSLVKKKSSNDLESVTNDSAVLLHLLAKHTKLFRRYFDYDGKVLATNEDALFIGKLLSHYQHVILNNAIMVVLSQGEENIWKPLEISMIRDTYVGSSRDWSWIMPKEENCSGLYLNPFLSLLNHSCNPNVARCETESGETLLFSIQPIAKGYQIFSCYGPMYCEMALEERQSLILNRFYFVCDCVACTNDWPIFTEMLKEGLSYTDKTTGEIDATMMAHEKCDYILQSLQENKFDMNPEALRDLSYAICLTVRFCQLPNWRLPSLAETLITVYNVLYGYLINVPTGC